MDQAKQFMSVLKKHHFWVLCGMVALLGLVFWWMATSGLSSEFEANKSAILAKAKDVESVIAITPHPNQKGVSLLDKEIKEEKDAVLEAWELLYEKQQELFQWPVDFWGEDFVAHVEAPENKNSIDPKYLDIYARFVPEQVAKLGEIVDAEWKPSGAAGGYGSEGSYGAGMSSMYSGSSYSGESAAGGLYPGGEFDPNFKRHKVQWNPANQQMIMDWFTWTETPPTAAVRVAQEDLWIYQALCGVIAAANENATGPHDAAVQAIEQLSIGYDAAGPEPSAAGAGGASQNRIQIPGASGAAAGGGSSEMAMMAGGYEGTTSSEGSMAEGGMAKPPRPVGSAGGGTGSMYAPSMMSSGGGEVAIEEELPPEQKLLTWRYVDDTGKPLTAAELEATTQIGYRLMPFRMVLKVDQRQYDKLLIECRNSLLPIVVREVRINPTAASGMGSGGYGGSSGYSGSGMGSPSMSMEMSAGYGGSGGGSAEMESHVKTVHLSGVLYLIQPPDPEKLGIEVGSAEGAATEDAVTDDSATAAETPDAETPIADNASGDTPPAEPMGEAVTAPVDNLPAAADPPWSPDRTVPAADTSPPSEAADATVPETEPAPAATEPVP